MEVQFYQSTPEGFIIDEINNEYADGNVFGLIINPGALTHTSLALRDSLAGSDLPVIEVHISKSTARKSVSTMTAETCIGGSRGWASMLRSRAAHRGNGLSRPCCD